jgi:hypothetical protein
MNQRFGFIISGIVMLVAGPASVAAPDFETEVIPVLTWAGCNSGACHGAAIGRGGFRLSLLGYDPQADHDALVHEFRSRRVNLAHPEKSLLLTKPTAKLLHEGGQKLNSKGDGYRILLDWIRAGAPYESRRKLQSLTITPSTRTLDQPGDSFSIQVTARFSDGSQADVTRWAVLTPTDATAVRCSGSGEITALRRGQSAVMVRFLGEVGCVSVMVPLGDELPSGKRPRNNFIDDPINRMLEQLRLPHSPPADDAILVRRVHLDLVGRLPTPAETRAYLTDPRPDRFSRLVESLMEQPQFADYWAYQWSDLLRIESGRLGVEGTDAFHGWVREQIIRKTPYDRMARTMLLSTVGPVHFSKVPRDAGQHAEYFSQVFLGVRLQCANCHNHPFDRWTQDDYHGLSAIFATLTRGSEVTIDPKGVAIHPRTGLPARPRIPGDRFLDEPVKGRFELADWLTSAENPYFARAAVNRIWRQLMGRGLVEPLDDHRPTNPPTHPDLLDAMAKHLTESGWSIRDTVRAIVSSAAYQRSSLSVGINKIDDRFYSRALVRPLPPVVMIDAVADVTGVPGRFDYREAGKKLTGPLAKTYARAIELPDSRIASRPLDLLGRCSRDASCEAGPAGGGLPLTLYKINGDWLNDRISNREGRLHRLLAKKAADAEIVSLFYETALCRRPTQRELDFWTARLQGDDRIARFEDFLWALLNSTEFGCNH